MAQSAKITSQFYNLKVWICTLAVTLSHFVSAVQHFAFRLPAHFRGAPLLAPFSAALSCKQYGYPSRQETGSYAATMNRKIWDQRCAQ